MSEGVYAPPVHERQIELLLVDELRWSGALPGWLMRLLLPEGHALAASEPRVLAVSHAPPGDLGPARVVLDAEVGGTRLRLMMAHYLTTALREGDTAALLEACRAAGETGDCDAAAAISISPARHASARDRRRFEQRVTYESLVTYFEEQAAAGDAARVAWCRSVRAALLRAIDESGAAVRAALEQRSDSFWSGYEAIAAAAAPQLRLKAPALGATVPAEAAVEGVLARPPRGRVRLRHSVAQSIVMLELLDCGGDAAPLLDAIERELPLDFKPERSATGLRVWVRVPPVDQRVPAEEQQHEVRHAIACLWRVQAWWDAVVRRAPWDAPREDA